MYFLILFLGLLLLAFNVTRWQRFRLISDNDQSGSVKQTLIALPCKDVLAEWYGYA